MASHNHIFVGFAVEDIAFRTLLVGHAKNKKSPFEFVDMSAKKPWDTEWKKHCRSKIKGCNGMITLVSMNTARAKGALWEVACALEEIVPVRGVYVNSNTKLASLPNEFSGVRVVDWTWDNIKQFIDSHKSSMW